MITATKLPVVTLAAVKYCAFASEETSCYEANVLVDGKKIGHVSNEGRGGGDNFWPHNIEVQLTEIAKAMPRFYPDLENSAELLMGQLLNRHLQTKDLKRALSKRLLFTKADGKIYQTKPMTKEELAAKLATGLDALKARFEGAVEVLNVLPIDKALELYEAGTKPEAKTPASAQA